MLHLKRASAGSGKTYQLAKTYIKLLLTWKEPGKPRKLRNASALRESLSSIMAVTFTVKATAEMKQRIVEKLAALAGADKISDDQIKDIDYLEEFMTDFRAKKEDIAWLAQEALKNLLIHYSDFKVQTIDAFFQGILHTFAYEARLDDNFNTEIDTEFVTSVGFDTALDTISDAYSDSSTNMATRYWIKKLMDQRTGSNKWNVFNRGASDSSLYSQLIKESANLEKESFQKIRKELADYFEKNGEAFPEMVEEIDRKNREEITTLHSARRKAAERLTEALDKAGFTLDDLADTNKTKGRVQQSLEELTLDKKYLKLFNPLKVSEKQTPGVSLKKSAKDNLETHLQTHPDVSAADIAALDEAFREWVETHNAFLAWLEQNSSALLTWSAYLAMIPKLMTVLEIDRKKREYLDATNTLQISDTNHFLSRIIGGEDTPFVYERMGSRLNHYLIDEFQDTSRMQWDNLYPLLAESESKEFDNLIIGDAKQSIYRFRNADYRLILEVEKQFHKVVPYTSDEMPKDLAAENTNFRSKRHIVEFNNHVFSNIMDVKVEKETNNVGHLFNPDVRTIYQDCIQAIPPKKLAQSLGYVELIFPPALTAAEKESGEDDSESFISIEEAGFKELPERILELNSRGYRFGEICVLVSTKSQGKTAVAAISSFNAANPDRQIEVISEENLLVNSALSIKLVIHALEMAVGGLGNEIKENPVLGEPIAESDLFALLKSLPSMALPSVVESIIERFVPESRRNEDAPFISAFQDAVLDYSMSHSSDIGSFLKWWERKGSSLAITSPQDSNGVVIQTIHKSKGLEYKCVIMPYAKMNFAPSISHKEWRWIKPSDAVKESDKLPPYIPVETVSSLMETEHADIWEQYYEEVSLDEINRLYVAFTRAENELYVYFPKVDQKVGKTSAREILLNMLAEKPIEGEKNVLSQEIRKEEFDNERIELKYGRPLTPEEIMAERKEKEDTAEILDSYEIKTEGVSVQFQNGNKLLNQPVHTGEGAELDPRAEGTLKHRILQMTRRPEDLDKALREMKVSGLVTSGQVEEWGRSLREAIGSVEAYGWFAPDVEVINERPLIKDPASVVRPDRIVVNSANEVAVIDYKFGVEEKKYHNQVRNYANLLLQTGRYNKVTPYLWYVEENKVVEVSL